MTTSLQSFRRFDRRVVKMLSDILNTPFEFVVTVDATLFPHHSRTESSTNLHGTNLHIRMYREI